MSGRISPLQEGDQVRCNSCDKWIMPVREIHEEKYDYYDKKMEVTIEEAWCKSTHKCSHCGLHGVLFRVDDTPKLIHPRDLLDHR